jgi:TolB-like protein
MNPRDFFSELKRRNVYRVAVAYAVVAWLLIQIATSTFPVLEIPNWATKLVIALVVLGFPIALILAWAFELTPEGIQPTKAASDDAAPKRRTRRGLFWTLVAGGALAALFLSFHFGRQWQPNRATTSSAAPAKRAVAVLPFENLSEDKANAYFADGMQDEIITRLARIGGLKVISRTSTLPYRTKPEKISQIAEQLGVGHVVEGSVQRISDRVRINVQLIDAATDDHLWAELYDRNIADVFAVQSEVATKIADSLQAKLSGREQQAMAEKPTRMSPRMTHTCAASISTRGQGKQRTTTGTRLMLLLRQCVSIRNLRRLGPACPAPARRCISSTRMPQRHARS